ncbi:hypothetical protein QK324_21695 [Serratia ureilytica]|uniref:hypothetical protein n=1 Tax=Serratia ureilytica TaxID=300181 RepID=UPI00249A238F|nr:hypothetical protein [Serratia ureilytica]MDI3200632.1 hypothetical protein [Serratia ureilytica]
MKLINFRMEFFLKYSFFVFVVMMVIGSNTAFANSWYQGGTLHEANALMWQKASQQNKIATCADFIAGLYSKNLLSDDISRKIKSVDDFKPYAAELVKQLDSAFKPEPKKSENEKMFANQTVKSTAMMLMIMMKWVNANGS